MVPQLPTELKINIIERISKSSLPAVSRANSSFREITEPILYSVVTLSPFNRQAKSSKVVVGCFRTMMARPSVAAAVRCLHVDLWHYKRPDHDVIGEVFETLEGALAKLVNLERLELPRSDNRWTFPPRLLRGCPLQSLQHYYGPPEVAVNIQSKVLVTLRIKSGGLKAVETSHALLAVARSNSGTLRALVIGRQRDRDEKWLEIVPQIPSLFPNVRFLDLGIWLPVGKKLINKLIPSLALLESLRLFQIGEYLETIPADRQKGIVKRLHKGCPQLRAIYLTQYAWCFDEDLSEWEPLSPETTAETESRIGYQRYLVDPQTDGFEYKLAEYWQ